MGLGLAKSLVSICLHQRGPKFADAPRVSPKTDAKHDVQRRPSDAAQDQSDIHCQFPPEAQVIDHHVPEDSVPIKWQPIQCHPPIPDQPVSTIHW
jgi:hypothetical protein